MWKELDSYEQWCTNCKEVVDADVKMDSDTGYIEVTCPICGEEDCDDVEYCECGEPMSKLDDFCPSCLDSFKTALDRFSDELPVGIETSSAIIYIADNWM